MTKEPLTEKLYSNPVSLGCDPEFFFEKKGKIIGSEKVININKGLKVKDSIYGSTNQQSKFIVDGVQAELNPTPNTCRANLGNEMSRCFRTLYNEMSKDKELSINFKPAVKITQKELDSLDEKSKVFGCSPSKNTDNKSKNIVKLTDAKKYKYRSAGGHIHLGHTNCSTHIKNALSEPERIVAIMDIIVGNTCVLIDRDPSNKERRKVYGRAGEFRTPIYGVEYRTLSNFWLRSYPLMSFVMSLSRFAVNIMANSMPGKDFENELLKMVNMKKISKAINTNNFELAWSNFQKIKPFIARVVPDNSDQFPLTGTNLATFEFFVKKGIDYWFKEDPIQHWIKIPEGHTAGWENFLKNIVTPQMMTEQPTPSPLIK